jgi:glyceraldehyde 3-phosphate dehydrogenase
MLQELDSRLRGNDDKKRKERKMTLKVAINGFGRIGRLVLRALYESGRKDIQVVAINDLGSVKDNAHLLKYDSVHGRFPFAVKTTDKTIEINGQTIQVVAQPDPLKLPWKDMGIDIAFECSGRFTKRDEAAAHLTAGAKRVLVSAPADGADATIVYGVNHETLKKEHTVVSNGSCTTNCLAPVADVLAKEIGIVRGFMTTVHAYTGDQKLVDSIHKDPRRARAAALSMIPSSTGAAKALGLVLPELKGKLDGTSVRVPCANVSMIDLVFEAPNEVTVDAINAAMKKAAEGRLKGVLSYVTDELVSSDFNHDAHSSNFDATQTQVVDKKMARVLSWYDNEWGFSNRMLDTAVVMGKLI